MSPPKIRFIHAAHALLGHQLRDVGPVPDDLRPTLQNATRTAWERLVELCLHEAVDALLLTGNTFSAADQSLEGYVALRAGLERLDEAGIPVFVTPGAHDPETAWRLLPEIPENVTCLGAEDLDPLTLSHDDGPAATIHPLLADTRDLDPHDGNGLAELALMAPEISAEDAQHPQIVMVQALAHLGTHQAPGEEATDLHAAHVASLRAAHECRVDYWAIEQGRAYRAWPVGTGRAVTPGALQGLAPAERGPHGALLVEITTEGTCHESLVPLSPVRFETIRVELTGHETLAEWSVAVRAALNRLPAPHAEEVWLLDCQLVPAPDLDFQRCDLQSRNVWFHEAIQSLSTSGCRLWLRHIGWAPEVNPPLDDFLEAEFAQQVTRSAEQTAFDERLAAALGQLPAGPLKTRIQQLLEHVTPEQVSRRAQQLGQNWLRAAHDVAQ